MILAPNHPTLDFVGFTLNKKLILGQLSMIKYMGGDQHAHNNLFERKFKKELRMNTLEFYANCAGLDIPKNKTLPNNIIHLYVTTSQSYLTKNVAGHKDPVYVVDGNELKRCDIYPEELLSHQCTTKHRLSITNPSQSEKEDSSGSASDMPKKKIRK